MDAPHDKLSDFNAFFKTNLSANKPLMDTKLKAKELNVAKLKPDKVLSKLEKQEFIAQRLYSKLTNPYGHEKLTMKLLAEQHPYLSKDELAKRMKWEEKADKMAKYAEKKLEKKTPNELANFNKRTELSQGLDQHIKANLQPSLQKAKESAPPRFSKDDVKKERRKSMQFTHAQTNADTIEPKETPTSRMSVKKEEPKLSKSQNLRRSQDLRKSQKLDTEATRIALAKEKGPAAANLSDDDIRNKVRDTKALNHNEVLTNHFLNPLRNLTGDQAVGTDFMRSMLSPDNWHIQDHQGRDLLANFQIDKSHIRNENNKDEVAFENAVQKADHVLRQMMNHVGYTSPGGRLSPEAEKILKDFRDAVDGFRNANPKKCDATTAGNILKDVYNTIKNGPNTLPDRGQKLAQVLNMAFNQNLINSTVVEASNTVKALRSLKIQDDVFGAACTFPDTKQRVLTLTPNGFDMNYTAQAVIKENLDLGKGTLTGQAHAIMTIQPSGTQVNVQYTMQTDANNPEVRNALRATGFLANG